MELTGYLGGSNVGDGVGSEEVKTVSGDNFSEKFSWQREREL